MTSQRWRRRADEAVVDGEWLARAMKAVGHKPPAIEKLAECSVGEVVVTVGSSEYERVT